MMEFTKTLADFKAALEAGKTAPTMIWVDSLALYEAVTNTGKQTVREMLSKPEIETLLGLPLKKQIEIDDWKNEYLSSKSGRAPIIGEAPEWVVKEQEVILGLYQTRD